MGLFDFFSKKNKQPEPETPQAESPLLDKVEVRPGIFVARAFADEWPAIEATRLEYAGIEAVPTESLRLEQSKLGHYPKIPSGFNYPKGSDGNYLYPLAQINFKEVPALPGYPTSGLLQFYISVHDDAWGLDFNGDRSQRDFRVHYFEEHEVENYLADFSFLQETIASDRSPVYKTHALHFSPVKEEYFGIGDVRYEAKGSKIVDQVTNKYPAIKDDLEESLYEDFSSNGHRIGGYAYFTQSDPREYDEVLKHYILLFQLDSDNEIMWGDVGVANFFIHPDDLAKKDFSKVLYNWDCC